MSERLQVYFSLETEDSKEHGVVGVDAYPYTHSSIKEVFINGGWIVFKGLSA